MLLCSGPFCTAPGTHSRSFAGVVASSNTARGTIVSEKSSFAFGLNSIRIVSSLATWVSAAFL
jgi:hypothetical protein